MCGPWPAVKETVTVPTERIDEVVHEDVLLLKVGTWGPELIESESGLPALLGCG